MWLLWRYTNVVGGANTKVYYPIARDNWQVNWYATSSTGNGPLDTINITHGVTADATYTRGNTPPDRMAAPIFNNNNSWV
jgi:hypothetical protein